MALKESQFQSHNYEIHCSHTELLKDYYTIHDVTYKSYLEGYLR